MTRTELVSLVTRIQAARDLGQDHSDLLNELRAEVSYPRVEELFVGDYSADYIVDFSLKWKAEWPKLSKQQMIDLVTKLINCEGSQADLAIMTLMFDANCLHPAKNGLIYYPDENFPGVSEPSAWQIVEKALSRT